MLIYVLVLANHSEPLQPPFMHHTLVATSYFFFPERYTLKIMVTTPSSSQIGGSRITLSKTLPVSNLFGELMSWKDSMGWGSEEGVDPCDRVRIPLIALRGRFHVM